MDTWAHCPTCVRWFYAAATSGPPADTETCPVCLSHPDRTEQRESVTVVTSAD